MDLVGVGLQRHGGRELGVAKLAAVPIDLLLRAVAEQDVSLQRHGRGELLAANVAVERTVEVRAGVDVNLFDVAVQIGLGAKPGPALLANELLLPEFSGTFPAFGFLFPGSLNPRLFSFRNTFKLFFNFWLRFRFKVSFGFVVVAAIVVAFAAADVRVARSDGFELDAVAAAVDDFDHPVVGCRLFGPDSTRCSSFPRQFYDFLSSRSAVSGSDT